MMTVTVHRGRAQPPLADQVVEEPGQLIGERLREPVPTRGHEPGNNNAEELLDRTAHLLGHRP